MSPPLPTKPNALVACLVMYFIKATASRAVLRAHFYHPQTILPAQPVARHAVLVLEVPVIA